MGSSPAPGRFAAFTEVFSSGPDGDGGPGWYLELAEAFDDAGVDRSW